MRIVEYGKENAEVIILLHGGGLSWWNYRQAANLLKDAYHVVIPILDGHAGSDTTFTSIEDNAKTLIQYIDEHLLGTVLAISGLSLGGQILVEMLSQKNDICRYAVIESTLVIPQRFVKALVSPAVAISYGLVKRRWFANMQFNALKMQESLFADYYRDTCKLKKQDMVRFLKANAAYAAKATLADTTAKALILVGGKEQKRMRQSATILHQMIQGSELRAFDEYHHGELSLNHPREYAELLQSLLATPTSSREG